MVLVGAYFPEALGFLEGEAGSVFGEDSGDEFVEPGLFCGLEEGGEGGFSRSLAAVVGMDVDAEFGDTVVAVARTVLGGGGEGDNLVLLGDYGDGIVGV